MARCFAHERETADSFGPSSERRHVGAVAARAVAGARAVRPDPAPGPRAVHELQVVGLDRVPGRGRRRGRRCRLGARGAEREHGGEQAGGDHARRAGAVRPATGDGNRGVHDVGSPSEGGGAGWAASTVPGMTTRRPPPDGPPPPSTEVRVPIPEYIRQTMTTIAPISAGKDVFERATSAARAPACPVAAADPRPGRRDGHADPAPPVQRGGRSGAPGSPTHTHDVRGNSDLLSLTQPDAIREIHRAYLAVSTAAAGSTSTRSTLCPTGRRSISVVPS